MLARSTGEATKGWAFASSIVGLAQVQSTSSHRIIRDFSARLRSFVMIITRQKSADLSVDKHRKPGGFLDPSPGGAADVQIDLARLNARKEILPHENHQNRREKNHQNQREKGDGQIAGDEAVASPGQLAQSVAISSAETLEASLETLLQTCDRTQSSGHLRLAVSLDLRTQQPTLPLWG